MQTLDGLLAQLQALKEAGMGGDTPVVYQDGGMLYTRLVAPGVEVVTAEQAAEMTDIPSDLRLIENAEQVITI